MIEIEIFKELNDEIIKYFESKPIVIKACHKMLGYFGVLKFESMDDVYSVEIIDSEGFLVNRYIPKDDSIKIINKAHSIRRDKIIGNIIDDKHNTI